MKLLQSDFEEAERLLEQTKSEINTEKLQVAKAEAKTALVSKIGYLLGSGKLREVEQHNKKLCELVTDLAKTEHSHPLGMVVSTHFRCGKWVKRGLKNGALPFNID